MSKKQKIKHPKRIAILLGSLSRESLSRNLAKYIMASAPPSLNFTILEIGRLRLYNEDLDDSPPKSWREFRKTIKLFDGFLFVTPEVNKSFPGALKNAIDIASRPTGHNVFDGKPGAVVSLVEEPASRSSAHPHLRQSLMFLNVQTMQGPKGTLYARKEMFDESGNLTNKASLDFMHKFMKSFDQWVNR